MERPEYEVVHGVYIYTMPHRRHVSIIYDGCWQIMIHQIHESDMRGNSLQTRLGLGGIMDSATVYF